MAISLDQFIEALVASGLFSTDEAFAHCSAATLAEQLADGGALAAALVRRNVLTDFQAAELLTQRDQSLVKSLVLGQYVLLDRLGAGGMGEVFLARHRRMQRLVALKVLAKGLAQDKVAAERFLREVRSVAALSHPHVVQAYDADEHDGTPYLVMEYVDGSDLGRLLQTRGPLTVDEAVGYVVQAAQGLAYVHERGILHRDIKPSNLLVDRAGVVKILDLGLARAASFVASDRQLTGDCQVVGTVDYMAPEQAADARSADARSDIYGLGCTLYRLLTNAAVYEGAGAMLKIVAHHTEPIPSLLSRRDDVPASLDAVVRKMLAKRPEDRQQSMREVAADLTKWRQTRRRASGDGREESRWTGFIQLLKSPFASPVAQVGGDALLESKTSSASGSKVGESAAEVDTDAGNETVSTSRGSSVARLRTATDSKSSPRTVGKNRSSAIGLALFACIGTWWMLRDAPEKSVPTSSAANVDVREVKSASPIVAASAPAIDNALSFDGIGSYVAIDGWSYRSGMPLTIEMWAYIATMEHLARAEQLASDSESGLSLGRQRGKTWQFQIGTNDERGGFHYRTAFAKTAVPVQKAVHFAGVYDGGEIRFYIDGKLEGREAVPNPTPSSTLPLVIGAVPQSGGRPKEYFFGNIDEVRVSKSARYFDDFQPDRLHHADGDTRALFHFDEGAGQIAVDASGNGLHGRIVDARWIRAKVFEPSFESRPVTIVNGVDVTK